MHELKACYVCFNTDVKLYSLNSGQLRQEFSLFSGIQTCHANGFPDYLCFLCSALVRNFKRFHDRCQQAHYVLTELLNKNKEIKLDHLADLNRSIFGIRSPLSYMSVDKTHYEQVKFQQWENYNRIESSCLSKAVIPVAQCSTLTAENTFEELTNSNTVGLEFNENNIKIDIFNETLPQDINIEYGPDKNESTSFVCETSADVEMADSSNEADDVSLGNDNFDSDNNQDKEHSKLCKVEKTEDVAEGSSMDEEYATLVPISVNEAKAAIEVYKLFSFGKHRCDICHKTYKHEERLKTHLRMHDKMHNYYCCEICKYYYSTELLLKTHMTEKHLFKYLCRKCPEVSFDRLSAKQHYVNVHLRNWDESNTTWFESRPKWLSNKDKIGVSGKKSKTEKRVTWKAKVAEDFNKYLTYSPIGPEEQYTLVQDRKKTRNYLESKYKCQFCYRGFRMQSTFDTHMKKHDPKLSGPCQCDICKLHFQTPFLTYKHMMLTHISKYTCQKCSFFCYNKNIADCHYQWHKNVTFPCPHCDKIFTKRQSCTSHIRYRHPSMYICALCGHSFVSEAGLRIHQRNISHSTEEIEQMKNTEVDKTSCLYCADCNIQFMTKHAFDTHLRSSNKHTTTNSVWMTQLPPTENSRGRPRTTRGVKNDQILNNGITTKSNCEVCNEFLASDKKARKHYEEKHPGTEYLKRYMCDVCGHTTKQYANLQVHMRTHTKEQPFSCPHCDRRFGSLGSRKRHLVVHTGEKPYKCQHCDRRFTQSSGVKLHIQTVHLKIPYPPRKRRKGRAELQAEK